jgi:hypothetical protein
MANPNPSPKNRFKPGQSGNPSGRSSAELEAQTKAAAIAAKLKLKALSSLQDKVEGLSGDEVIDLLMSPDALRMFKEVEDRAHGTPKATTEMSGADGGGIPMMLTVATKIIDAD